MKLPTEKLKLIPAVAENITHEKNTKGTFSDGEKLKQLIEELAETEILNIEIRLNAQTILAGFKQSDHYFVHEVIDGVREASLRFAPEALDEVLLKLDELIRQGAQASPGIHLDVLTWNLGVSWDHTDSYEGAWPFDEVMGVIDDNCGTGLNTSASEHSIIFLQEVPIREKSLGLHYYFDRLQDCLEAWGWRIYTTDRGMVKLVTAIKSCLIKESPAALPEGGRGKVQFPRFSNLPAEIAGDELCLINVHLRSNRDQCNREFEDFFSQTVQSSDAAWVLSAGDFNYDPAAKAKQGALRSGVIIGATGSTKPGRNLDHIYLGNARVTSEVLDRKLSPPRRAKLSGGGHYHLPVKATVILPEKKSP